MIDLFKPEDFDSFGSCSNWISQDHASVVANAKLQQYLDSPQTDFDDVGRILWALEGFIDGDGMDTDAHYDLLLKAYYQWKSKKGCYNIDDLLKKDLEK